MTFIGRYTILSWPVAHVEAFLSLIAATAMLLYGPKLLSVALLYAMATGAPIWL
ncbi:MAG: hypothetical protein WBM24_03775 [Candidatus Sulfotelmatobacter sp.]